MRRRAHDASATHKLHAIRRLLDELVATGFLVRRGHRVTYALHPRFAGGAAIAG